MSLIGMVLGVASLTAAMGVVSGFESTLKTAVIDVFGHVQVVRRTDRSPVRVEAFLARVKEIAPETQWATPFLFLEGVVAGGGKISGVAIQGVDPKTVENVLHIRPRLIRGQFAFEPVDGHPVALVGKGLEKKFGLKVGESFKVVLPTPSRSDSTEFAPRVQTFVLGGVLDLGKAEYDDRYVVTDLVSAQRFADVGDGISGARLKLVEDKAAPAVATRLARELGSQYWTMDWFEVNKNLFDAIKIERVVIFFVILIMVIAASFNIASNLFINVLQKYSDISILRALGFSGRDVSRVFLLQGLFFGAIGTAAGLALGLLLCAGFVVLQKYVVLLPVDVYKIDHVGVELRAFDLAAIVVSALLICLISTLVPARRGAKLDPVEGLRYE